MSGIIYTPPPGTAGNVIADSGTFTSAFFVGSVLQINHTLGVIPTAVTIFPNDLGGAALLNNTYFVTVSINKIFINFTSPTASLGAFSIIWGVFKT